jgi:hypothetical protein
LLILLCGIVVYLFVQCYYSSFCLTLLFFLLFNVFFILLLGTIAHLSASSCLFCCSFLKIFSTFGL